ncbi:peptidylprolyl isomerase [Paracandidimonas soli]|uniref:peptidylprolyl isomerase n=1 Tax=Paracandidimonas soli TaxID=1917182 RepID=UPI00333E7671
MAVTVNGVELTDAEMEAEIPHYADAKAPVQMAMTALVLRRVLLDEAQRLGIRCENDEQAIDRLLESQVQAPVPDDAACRRYYESNPAQFTVGELIEADHILFQVTPGIYLDGLRSLAQETLDLLQTDASQFAAMARKLSNCPSGEVGGSLGQLARGDTVPEFERIVFAMAAGSMLPRLLETRFGFHIVRVNRKIEGRLQPYEAVAGSIASALAATSRDTAWRQYVKQLVGKASIKGISLEGADSPLVQ